MAKKVKYRVVHEGAQSQVYEIPETDEEYHWEVDNYWVFYNRKSAVKRLRQFLKDEIASLKYTLKRIK